MVGTAVVVLIKTKKPRLSLLFGVTAGAVSYLNQNSDHVAVVLIPSLRAGAGDPATWEELGPVVDLSAYATTAYVDNAIETALTWATF